MKGTELDNRRRFAQVSPQTAEEREFAAWVSQSELELTQAGELRDKRQVATQTTVPRQLPEVGWD